MFNDALRYRNRYGLLAEDIHPRTGELWGNFPSDLLHGRVDTHRDAAVAQLGGPILARIVVVSNRVSVPSGDSAKRAGGLEVALRPALERNGGVWFGWSGKAVPGADVEMHTVCHKNVTYVVTDLSEEDYQEYYNGFANRVLWPILHFRLDLAEFARRDLTGYMRVNDHFATELEKIIEPDDLIWVHDYHLIPIADALRRRGHANRIGFFLHVPMPPPEVLASLPNHEQLIPLLLQYDVVGFQTDGDSGNFVRYLIAENRGFASRDAGVRNVGPPNLLYLERAADPGRQLPRRHRAAGISGRSRAETCARRWSRTW